jgi:hypothetical protein
VAAAVPSLAAHHIRRRVQPHTERVRALLDLGARDDAQTVEDGRAGYLCVCVSVRVRVCVSVCVCERTGEKVGTRVRVSVRVCGCESVAQGEGIQEDRVASMTKGDARILHAKNSTQKICAKNLRTDQTRTAYLVSVHHAVFADRDQHGHVGHGGRVLGGLARRGVGGGLGGGAATVLSGGRSGRWQDRGEVETKESMYGQKYERRIKRWIIAEDGIRTRMLTRVLSMLTRHLEITQIENKFQSKL